MAHRVSLNTFITFGAQRSFSKPSLSCHNGALIHGMAKMRGIVRITFAAAISGIFGVCSSNKHYQNVQKAAVAPVIISNRDSIQSTSVCHSNVLENPHAGYGIAVVYLCCEKHPDGRVNVRGGS